MRRGNKKIFIYMLIFIITLITINNILHVNRKTNKIVYNKYKYSESESETTTEDSEKKLKMLTADIDKNLTILKNNQNSLKDKLGFLTNSIDEKLTSIKIAFDSFKLETKSDITELKKETENNFNQVKTEIANNKTDIETNKNNITTLTNEMTELKKSVSDGKSSIASAITAQGVTTAADATFETMATNISKISGTASSASSLFYQCLGSGHNSSCSGSRTINSGEYTILVFAFNVELEDKSINSCNISYSNATTLYSDRVQNGTIAVVTCKKNTNVTVNYNLTYSNTDSDNCTLRVVGLK